MKVICCECKRHMSGDVDDAKVSHGMCASCAEAFERAVMRRWADEAKRNLEEAVEVCRKVSERYNGGGRHG